MDILIVRDGGATKVPRVVAGQAEADALVAAGFEVEYPTAAEVAEPEAKDPEPAKHAKKPAKHAAG